MLVGHLPELILLLVALVLIFGPGKLPSVGGAIGKTIREFKRETAGLHAGPRDQALPNRDLPRQG